MEKIKNNSGIIVRLDTAEATNICKIGQGEKCCAYLAMGTNGFECIKKDPSFSKQISKRLSLGTMVSKGEGGWKECAWEEDK